MSKNPDWKEYYRDTKDKPPSPLLVQALEYVQNKEKAIDIGGGALKDTRFLIEQGFEVTVIDKEESLVDMVASLDSERVHPIVSSFVDFDFPVGEYDIASAMYSLPFNSPETFDRVFGHIKNSLAPQGIFCGQFFGTKDEWRNNPKMSFHTKSQVEEYLDDMEILKLTEEERDGKTANGQPKHWHIIHFIARKI